MIAADDNRRANTLRAYELVDLESESCTRTVAKPADARRQSLERDALARHMYPATECGIIRKHVERCLIGYVNVFWITRKGCPAERPLAFAEQRPHIFRHEAGNVKRVFHAALLRLCANVVAVVEGHRTARFHREHRFHVSCHRLHRLLDIGVRVAFAQSCCFSKRHAARHVAVERIMCGCLIGQDVGYDTTTYELWEHISCVAFETYRSRHLVAAPGGERLQRLVEIRCGRVEISRLETTRDATWINFNHQCRRAVHRRGERLRATHAAETGGDDNPSTQGAAEMAMRSGGESLVSALQNALCTDVNPAAGRHLAVHRQAAMFEITKCFPGGPRRYEHRVGDDHPRRTGMRAKHADRLS